jgi:hypothetical protein
MNPEDIELLPEMQNQLGIKSLRDLESRLLINRVTLRRLATEVEKHYEPFPQEKRRKPFQRPKKDEKKKIREIDNPSKELKCPRENAPFAMKISLLCRVGSDVKPFL